MEVQHADRRRRNAKSMTRRTQSETLDKIFTDITESYVRIH